VLRQIRWRRCKPQFAGKVVFISGGSSGIGEQLCKMMVKMGAKHVIIAARRLEELERVKQECAEPNKVSCLQLDLNKPRECLIKMQSLSPKPDIVINNGGISMREEFSALEFSVCESMVNTNLLSHIAVVKACLPHMAAQKNGMIVNISSGSGIFGMPLRTMYCATKFGLSGFGKALRSEVKHLGVKVIQIYPGYVKTNISLNAMTSTGEKFGKVDSNIDKGQPVDEACMDILKAMHLGRTEVMIGDLKTQLLPLLVSNNTVAQFLSQKFYKHQHTIKDKAE
jgi:short-subunit dehydrogenase